MTTTAQPTVYLLKRGDSFWPTFGPTYDANDTGPFDFSAWSVRSQVRDAKNKTLISQLVVIWTDHAAGIFTLKPTVDDTSTWPIGDLQWDIEYTNDEGRIESSQTFILRVSLDVTRTDPADQP